MKIKYNANSLSTNSRSVTRNPIGVIQKAIPIRDGWGVWIYVFWDFVAFVFRRPTRFQIAFEWYSITETSMLGDVNNGLQFHLMRMGDNLGSERDAS